MHCCPLGRPGSLASGWLSFLARAFLNCMCQTAPASLGPVVSMLCQMLTWSFPWGAINPWQASSSCSGLGNTACCLFSRADWHLAFLLLMLFGRRHLCRPLAHSIRQPRNACPPAIWEQALPKFPSPHVQLVTLVVGGGRLEIPPRDRLPGYDTAAFSGLDAYVALLKRCWAQNPCEQHPCQRCRGHLKPYAVFRCPLGSGVGRSCFCGCSASTPAAPDCPVP